MYAKPTFMKAAFSDLAAAISLSWSYSRINNNDSHANSQQM